MAVVCFVRSETLEAVEGIVHAVFWAGEDIVMGVCKSRYVSGYDGGMRKNGSEM